MAAPVDGEYGGPGPGAGEGGDPALDPITWVGGEPSPPPDVNPGDAINVVMPEAQGGSGSFRYRWRTDPRSGNPFITYYQGVVGGRHPLVQMSENVTVRGSWQAIDESSGDILEWSFRFDVISPNRLRIPDTPVAITVQYGGELSARTLPAATGGVPPYRYVLRAFPGTSTPSPSAIGLSFDPSTRSLSSSRITGAPRTYRYAYWVYDQIPRTDSRGHTLVVTVQPAPITRPLAYSPNPIVFNRIVGRFQTDVIPFNASGGSLSFNASYRYTAAFTNLPATLTATDTGGTIVIRGTPAGAAVINGTLTVQDSVSSITVPITIRVQATGRSLPGGAYELYHGQSVNRLLPALRNAAGTPVYRASNTAGLAALGLTITGQRITGTAREGSTSFSWHVQDRQAVGDTTLYTAQSTIRVSVGPRLSVLRTAPAISVVEGTNVNRTLPRASGGYGAIRYRKRDLLGLSGTDLSLSDDGIVSGNAASVGPGTSYPNGFTRTVRLEVYDSVGNTAPIDLPVSISDTPVTAAPLVLPGRTVDVPSGFTGGITVPTWISGGGSVASALRATGGKTPYTYAALTGLPAGVIYTPNPPQLAFALTASDDETDVTLSRSVTDANSNTASGSLRLIIRARLLFQPITELVATTGGAVSVSRTLRATGGRPPYTYSVKTNLPSGSGCSAAVSGDVVTITGASPVAGAYQATMLATDWHGRTVETPLHFRIGHQDDGTDSDTFRFLESEFILNVTAGDEVVWLVPTPVRATGGVVSVKIVPDPPIRIAQPAVNADGVWSVGGDVPPDSLPREEVRELVATDSTGATARADLIIRIRERRPSTVPGACGVGVVAREPQNPYIPFTPGDTTPDSTGLGAIRSFTPDAFIKAPGEDITFSWEVVGNFAGVPILEVDFYWQDGANPWCRPGVPRMNPQPSVEHVTADNHRQSVPMEPGVYTYRLEALRAGQSRPYLRADYWDITVLVTEDADATHLSRSKGDMPGDWPSVLQIGVKGAQPTGDWSVDDKPVRVSDAVLTDRTPDPADPTPIVEPEGTDPDSGGAG